MSVQSVWTRGLFGNRPWNVSLVIAPAPPSPLARHMHMRRLEAPASYCSFSVIHDPPACSLLVPWRKKWSWKRDKQCWKGQTSDQCDQMSTWFWSNSFPLVVDMLRKQQFNMMLCLVFNAVRGCLLRLRTCEVHVGVKGLWLDLEFQCLLNVQYRGTFCTMHMHSLHFPYLNTQVDFISRRFWMVQALVILPYYCTKKICIIPKLLWVSVITITLTN